ncbi:MAG: hypothetical protein LBR55_07065 [Bacteroidales bacterium]|jgi:2-keto-4-pentenoate hydratase/2-oxohepta-3-ene-1,7-dioic acid hydratase in catechol pathway|nr:hypothetical protein [Bacteroidales bacterium]
MKIIALNQPLETTQDFAFSCLPDSAIVRNNDDFYLPNFSSHIQAQVGLYCNMHKIGKHIEPQFAHRYIKECGCAINFIAVDTLNSLHAASLPTDIALGFDHSFAISNATLDFTHARPQLHIRFEYNNQLIFDNNAASQLEALYCAIAKASEYVTYKIGDMFFVPLLPLHNIHTGNTFNAYINEKHFLTCKIR